MKYPFAKLNKKTRSGENNFPTAGFYGNPGQFIFAGSQDR